MVYNTAYAAIGIIHGLCGVFWVGIHFANELYIIRDMRKAQKLADMPALRAVPRVSMVAAILGMLTLATGLIFLFIRWPIDVNTYLYNAEARTVIIALAVVLVVLVLGFGVLKPGAEKLGKRAATLGPMDPLPEDVKKDILRLAKFLDLSGALVVTALILMILAINGGI